MSRAWRSDDLEPELATWVLGPEAGAYLDELVVDPASDALATASRLRAAGLSPERAAAIQSVAAASRTARAAGHGPATWWTPAALEQASRPEVSAWRAARYTGAHAIDVTAGCGGDAAALGRTSSVLLAADRSASRLAFLRTNLGDSALVVQADALQPCVATRAWSAWADPSRRHEGRRLQGLGACRPAVPALAALGFDGLGIAVSPAVDLADPDRPGDAELEFVQVGRQLVEATLWLGGLRDRGPGPAAAVSATLLPDGLHRRGRPRPPDGVVADLGAWLAVPAPALVRARLVDELAEELGLGRLARTRALFTGDAVDVSPWFRFEAVEAVVPARPRQVRDALRGLASLPVEILTHGMDVDVSAWWRAIGSPPRGPEGRGVHLVRLDDRSVAILTRRRAA